MRNTSRVILGQKSSGARLLTNPLSLRMAELRALRRKVVEAEQMARSRGKSVVRAQPALAFDTVFNSLRGRKSIPGGSSSSIQHAPATPLSNKKAPADN